VRVIRLLFLGSDFFFSPLWHEGHKRGPEDDVSSIPGKTTLENRHLHFEQNSTRVLPARALKPARGVVGEVNGKKSSSLSS
jgi:hypothetical protein